ncbi:glycosyltransferase family 2 protein [Metabacillus sp. SLBN-84]
MKLSVIIPTYNLSFHICKTLSSLTNQNEYEYEVIIVDDGSTDRTSDIAREYLCNNSFRNFQVIEKENGGVSSARNTGINYAKGDYVLFLDGDDLVSERLMQTLEEHLDGQNDVVCWGYDRVDQNNNIIEHYFSKYKNLNQFSGYQGIKNIIVEEKLFIAIGSAAYKRSILLDKNIRFTEDCSNGEDQEFIYKYLSESSKIKFVNEVLLFYVTRIGSISNSYNIRKFDVFNAMKRTINFFESKQNYELSEMSNYIKNNFIVRTYLVNFFTCVNYDYNSSKNTNAKAKDLLLEIDKHYPGLNKEVNYLMGRFQGSTKLKLQVKLFLFSPVVFINMMRIKKIINKIFN